MANGYDAKRIAKSTFSQAEKMAPSGARWGDVDLRMDGMPDGHGHSFSALTPLTRRLMPPPSPEGKGVIRRRFYLIGHV
ncbi:hypothetical protein, partial [Stenotrophomonas maltophilia]|uniref:hypothetical protein n=1 Tax=Stenotrophomonas maltophilia TaxID=40324 RepID=UPI001954E702